jgi:GDP-L-fucose synthase
MKILITGSSGLVGSAVTSRFISKKLLLPSSKKLDLTNKNQTYNYIKKNKPDLIIHCAGKVGGILKNIKNQEKFLIENSQININIISSALKFNVKNFLNLSSSCIYPKNISTKIKEKQLLQSYPEPTNEGYALAKISALKLCSYIKKKYNLNYKSLIPCNIYGSNDNFDINSGHLIPSVIHKIHKAKKNGVKEVAIWGLGKVRREFMHVNDLADAIFYFAKRINEIPDFLNIGYGRDYTIDEYYKTISKVIGYNGKFKYDTSKPTGMKRKLLNVKMQNKFGWKPKISLENGVKKTYKSFLKYYDK